MNSERRHSLLSTRAAVLWLTAGLGLAIAFAQGARAQQAGDKNSGQRKDEAQTRKSNTANQPGVAQAAPAAPATRRETKRAERREAKRARRAMTLGIQVQPQGNQGLQVSGVEENGLAARAGLQQNDRIVSVDGRTFTSGRQLDAYLASQGGRRVPMVIERDGQQMTIPISPAELAADTAWLGVYLEEGEPNTKGARIVHIYPSGPAARAGLRAGDTITQVNDQKIEHPSDLISLVQEMEPQAQANFVVMRDDQETKIPVTLGSRQHFVPPGGNQGGYGPNGGGNEQPGYADQDGHPMAGGEAFEDVPPHAMHLEHDRRIAEQHQRIEQELQALREEIRQLREELKKK